MVNNMVMVMHDCRTSNKQENLCCSRTKDLQQDKAYLGNPSCWWRAGWGGGEGELAQQGRTEGLTMVFSSILKVEAISFPVPEPGAAKGLANHFTFIEKESSTLRSTEKIRDQLPSPANKPAALSIPVPWTDQMPFWGRLLLQPLLKTISAMAITHARTHVCTHLQTRFLSCYGQSRWNRISVTMESPGVDTWSHHPAAPTVSSAGHKRGAFFSRPTLKTTRCGGWESFLDGVHRLSGQISHCVCQTVTVQK